MRTFIALSTIAVAISAITIREDPAHKTRFLAALKNQSAWNSFRNENTTHMAASKKKRAHRNGLVQKYFDAHKI